jgi:hypothetical protein
MNVFEPWDMSEADWSTGESRERQVRFVVACSVLAPSSHNTQPWRFAFSENAIELHADRVRVLPVADPHHRELTMSCGAALFHLRSAIRHLSFEPLVDRLPSEGSVDFLARIRLGSESARTDEELELFNAIPQRHTNRRAFEDRPLPSDLIEALREAATKEGAWLEFVDDGKKRVLADLIAQGDRTQGSDRPFRRELAQWINPNRSSRKDGMPGYAHAMSDLMSNLGPLMIRRFDWGKRQAVKDTQLALDSPALVVLGTDSDGVLDWIRAGEALDRVLLRATAAGASASFLNQPIQVEELRPAVAELLERGGYPQVILRIGFGPKARPTPRRSAQEVMKAT